MLALSLYQPWASLVVLNEKRFETRSWYTSHRGRILIHAAKSIKAREFIKLPAFRDVLAKHDIYRWADFPLGAIIGDVTLVGCCPTHRVRPHISEQEKAFGDFGPGRFAWELANPVVFPNPIPKRGAQKLFEVEGWDAIPSL